MDKRTYTARSWTHYTHHKIFDRFLTFSCLFAASPQKGPGLARFAGKAGEKEKILVFLIQDILVSLERSLLSDNDAIYLLPLSYLHTEL